MNVLVDTSVWSLALRRRQEPGNAQVRELRELIGEGRAQLIGPVRQEILSGIRSTSQASALRDHLRAFPDLELNTEDFERAAEHYNSCRQKGIQGSNTDFLICAVAERRQLPILTTDGDFRVFQKVLPIALHQPRSSARDDR